MSLWAILVSSGALWLLISAKPWWAPALDGFEMFKFGAEYGEQIHDFKSKQLQDCGDALNNIPGMIGVLPGLVLGKTTIRNKGYIGLSENTADVNIEYTSDRRVAALSRVP